MKKKVFTLATWGKFEVAHDWIDWFRFMEASSESLGSPLTHFGIRGDQTGSKGIRQIDDFWKIQNTIESANVKWLSGYSLPVDYQTASFDYNVHMNRSDSYVSISAKEGFAEFLIKNTDEWVEKEAAFCITEKYLFFQMDEDESPLFLVSGSSSPDKFKSLKILKEFS